MSGLDGMDGSIYLRSLVLKEHRQSDANNADINRSIKPWISPVVQPGAPLPNKLNPRDADKQLGHVLLLAADGQLQAHLVIKIIDQQLTDLCSLCIRHQSAASAGLGFLLH